jgi:transcriptional regulator with XRE-family HTH domain
MEKVDIYESLGGNIRRERARLAMNQGELARKVGLSRTSVTNVELGRQGLAVHQLFEFAAALGVEPCRLLPEEPRPKPSVERIVTPELSQWVATLRSKSMRL